MSIETVSPVAGANPALAGSAATVNPGFTYYKEADGTAYFNYQGPYNSFGGPTTIQEPFATLSDGTRVSVASGAPSFETQIFTVQDYIARARATGQIIEVGPALYHPNGNIQYQTIQAPTVADPLIKAVTAGLVDPAWLGSVSPAY